MAGISVSASYKGVKTRLTGEYIEEAVLTVSGLSAGAANTIAHGLPRVPIEVCYVPTDGNGNWYETSAPDATNIYITSGASGPDAFRIFVKY
jgi:hypothetical protein